MYIDFSDVWLRKIRFSEDCRSGIFYFEFPLKAGYYYLTAEYDVEKCYEKFVIIYDYNDEIILPDFIDFGWTVYIYKCDIKEFSFLHKKMPTNNMPQFDNIFTDNDNLINELEILCKIDKQRYTENFEKWEVI